MNNFDLKMNNYELIIDFLVGDYGYYIGKICENETVRRTRQIFFADYYECKHLEPLIVKYGYNTINDIIMALIDRRETENESRSD